MGLTQDCSYSSVLTMELPQSYPKLLIWFMKILLTNLGIFYVFDKTFPVFFRGSTVYRDVPLYSNVFGDENKFHMFIDSIPPSTQFLLNVVSALHLLWCVWCEYSELWVELVGDGWKIKGCGVRSERRWHSCCVNQSLLKDKTSLQRSYISFVLPYWFVYY